ncbi:MAG: PilZ domain-containing protein, partial [Acidobacteriota bacterium]|nr:PilZ domain-containing protein [Acidobacteriota bacterium]
MNERRIHPRLNLPLESHYSLDGSDLEQVATMLDLSAGGAGLQLPRELPIGTQLDFRFVLPPDGGRSGMPILARAEVARTEKLETEDEDLGFLTGLRFVELGADSFQRIQQFVFAHLTKGQPQPEEMPLERRRVEIKSPISIRFDRFDDFENEVSGDLSLSGMFIRSDHPKPPGTIFTFEYQLDDFPLVSGRAEVVWTRIRSQGPGMVPGMGVRFLDLDDSSRNVIRRLVESKLQEGETSLVAEDRRVAGRSKPHRISRPLKRPEPPEEETETEIDKLRRELARRTKEFSDQEERLKQQIMDLTNREVEHQDRLRTSEHSL